MEFYEKPSLEDLEHYGVKGMRWGVIRTPEQLGRRINRLKKKQSTATGEKREKINAKLKKAESIANEYTSNYRERELKKAVKRNDKKIARLEKSYNRAVDRGSKSKISKRRYYLDEATLEKFIEEEFIKKMSFDDIIKERFEAGREYSNSLVYGTNMFTPLSEFIRVHRVSEANMRKLKDEGFTIIPNK